MTLLCVPSVRMVHETAIGLLLFLLWVGGGPAHAQVSSGLAAYYGFEQSSGRTILDSSGSGNDTTLDFAGVVRTVAWGSYPRWTQGGGGLALHFDGLDDRIIVPSSPSLQLPKFTIALWVKVGQASNVYVKQDLRLRGHTFPATMLRRGSLAGGGTTISSLTARPAQ